MIVNSVSACTEGKAGDTAKILAALTAHQLLNRQPPETSVKSEGLLWGRSEKQHFGVTSNSSKTRLSP